MMKRALRPNEFGCPNGGRVSSFWPLQPSAMRVFPLWQRRPRRCPCEPANVVRPEGRRDASAAQVIEKTRSCAASSSYSYALYASALARAQVWVDLAEGRLASTDGRGCASATAPAGIAGWPREKTVKGLRPGRISNDVRPLTTSAPPIRFLIVPLRCRLMSLAFGLVGRRVCLAADRLNGKSTSVRGRGSRQRPC